MSPFFRTALPPSVDEMQHVHDLTRKALELVNPALLVGDEQLGDDERRQKQLAWEEAWEEVKRADGASYTVNSVGLAAIAYTMGNLGMMVEATEPLLPSLEEFGLARFPSHEEGTGPGGSHTAAEVAFLGALRTTWEKDSDLNGIPSYKLSSDDDWLITPREVRAALDVYDALDEKRRHEASGRGRWWENFIHFLRGVPARGGMRRD